MMVGAWDETMDEIQSVLIKSSQYFGQKKKKGERLRKMGREER